MAEKPLTFHERRGKTQYDPWDFVDGTGQVEGVDTNEVLNWVQAQTQTESLSFKDRGISLTFKDKGS